jgi:peptidoglycan/LPS O-acetylase OafA/YrhL
VNGEARPARIPHVVALDGARGAAVAGVLLFHGGHLTGGYLGVDFFFVLSGFLITSLLLAESDRTGGVGLGGFWARRARRLLPALAVMMVGVALYSWAFAAPEQVGQIRGDALATLGYVANWHEIFSHQSYFALFTTPSPLNHTWSLSIEEQFYVIWPLVFVGLLAWWKRAVPRAVLVMSLALATVSSVLMIALYHRTDSTRAYFGTDTRAAAILFGAALAAALAVRGPVTTRTARHALEALGIIGAAVLAISWARLDGQSPMLYRGGFLLCGLAATAVIAAAVHPEPGPVARALSFKPLCALGWISYGVYLYHWPIDVFLDAKRVGFGGWPLFAFRTTVTLTVAIASYRIVEQPVRHGALSSVQWRKFTPAIAMALVVAIFVGTNGAQPTLLSAGLSRHPLRDARAAYERAPAGAQRIMLVGDSVALLLGRPFESLRTNPSLAVFDAGVPGCAFPPQISNTPLRLPDGKTVPVTPCPPVWEAAAVARFRPDIVFWVLSPGRGGTYQGQTVLPCSEQYAALYRESLPKQIAALGAHGAKVVITTAAYTRAYLNMGADAAADCDNRLRRSLAAANGAQLVDLFEYICPHGKCRTKQDGKTLRPDGLHYDGPGGEIVARWLLDQVR